MGSQEALPNAVLTVYPLTRDFRAKVVELAGPDAIYMTFGDLRTEGLRAMFARLRRLKVDRVYLPLEQGEGEALLPVIMIVSRIIPHRGAFLLRPDLQPVPVATRDVAASGVSLLRASLRARRDVRKAAREIETLLAAPRLDPVPPTVRDVLYLNANLWFGVKAGGSVGHISGVVNGFLDCGYPVSFVSAGGRLLARPEVTFTPLEPPASFGIPWEHNFYTFHYDVVAQSEKHARRRDFGCIYQRLSIANFSGVELSRRRRKPLILEYNGSEAWIAKNWGRPLRTQALAEKVEEANLRHAHLIVTISDVLRDELLERGIPAERIVSYPNCIDPPTFDPARFAAAETADLRRKYGIAEDALVTTFLGTFGQWHGASVLAEAVRKLVDERPELVTRAKMHFLFVGDGLKMPEVRAALGQHVGSPHVTLAGLVPQDQAPLHLAASDILASPHVPNADGTRFFGSPTKLFEYMAMGKAIIASDLDQIGEVLAGSLRVRNLPDANSAAWEGPPALLATPGSPDDIVDGLKFLAERPDWRQSLGASARRLALGKYTWQHHVKAILDRALDLGLIVAVEER